MTNTNLIPALRRELSRLADVLVHDCDPYASHCNCFGEADVIAYRATREALRQAEAIEAQS